MKKYLFLGSLLMTAGIMIGSDPLMDLNKGLSELNSITPPPPLLDCLTSETTTPANTATATSIASVFKESYFGWKMYMGMTIAAGALYLFQTKCKNFYTPLTSLSELTTNQEDIEWYVISLEKIKTLNHVTAQGNNVQNILEQIKDWVTENHQSAQPLYRCSGLVKIKGQIGTRKLLEKYFTCADANSITTQFVEPFIRASYPTVHNIDQTLRENAQYYLTISCQDFKHCYLPSKTVSANSYQELMEEFFKVLKTYIKPDTHYTLKLQISLESPAAGKRLFVTPSAPIIVDGNTILRDQAYDRNHGYDGNWMNFCTLQGYANHRKYLSQTQGIVLQSFWNTNESLQSYTSYRWNNNRLVPHLRNDENINNHDNEHNNNPDRSFYNTMYATHALDNQPCSSSSSSSSISIKLSQISNIVENTSNHTEETLSSLRTKKQTLSALLLNINDTSSVDTITREIELIDAQMQVLTDLLREINKAYDLKGVSDSNNEEQ